MKYLIEKCIGISISMIVVSIIFSVLSIIGLISSYHDHICTSVLISMITGKDLYIVGYNRPDFEIVLILNYIYYLVSVTGFVGLIISLIAACIYSIKKDIYINNILKTSSILNKISNNVYKYSSHREKYNTKIFLHVLKYVLTIPLLTCVISVCMFEAQRYTVDTYITKLLNNTNINYSNMSRFDRWIAANNILDNINLHHNVKLHWDKANALNEEVIYNATRDKFEVKPNIIVYTELDKTNDSETIKHIQVERR